MSIHTKFGICFSYTGSDLIFLEIWKDEQKEKKKMGIDYNQQKFEEFDIRKELSLFLGVDVALPFLSY